MPWNAAAYDGPGTPLVYNQFINNITVEMTVQPLVINGIRARITMTAQKVPPNPFFKKWRPQVPQEAIYASFAAAKTYSTCFTGVSVPFVCTSGSKVCGYK